MKREIVKGSIKINLKNVKKKEIKLLTNGIRVVVERNGAPGICPYCKTPSTRVYEYRKQIIFDKPHKDKKIELELNKRRFVCVNPSCPVKTFTEEFPGLNDTKRCTVEFEKFVKKLIHKQGCFRTHRILKNKYNLKLSPSTLFYWKHRK